MSSSSQLKLLAFLDVIMEYIKPKGINSGSESPKDKGTVKLQILKFDIVFLIFNPAN